MDKYSMKKFDRIGNDLFNKIRGRFPEVTIGDEEGNVTNEPTEARFFDFKYKDNGSALGKVSISLDEDEGLTVIYSKDFVSDEGHTVQKNWYSFLKELRVFSKKRMLNFSVRDITKSNLNKRDYKFLSANRTKDDNMNESTMYGNSRMSYQNIDNARLVIKHSDFINNESSAGRTQKISRIYIENNEGERFKYPFKHLSGARAMARHVSEGGNPYDEFGEHIVGLSEELSKLKKFKTHVNRSSVMAETLSEYTDVVKERISTIKKTLETLQKKNSYTENFENFETPVFEEVPEDVADNWIDQLTIKQFNEELKDVFPYIYRLVSEHTRTKSLGPDELVGEDDDPCWKNYKQVGMKKKNGKKVPNCVPKEETELEAVFDEIIGQFGETDHDSKYDFDDENNDDQPDEKVKEDDAQLSDFILSYYDRNTGTFPKGETAVLTMVEKDYGDEFIEPAKAFIEQVNALYSGVSDTRSQELDVDRVDAPNNAEYDSIVKLAGLR